MRKNRHHWWGNLGSAIAEGLLKSKFSNASDIYVTKRNTGTLVQLEGRGVKITDINREAVTKAEVIILAVKPYQVSEAVNSFKDALSAKHILVSVVTGLLIKDLESCLEKKLPVFVPCLILPLLSSKA